METKNSLQDGRSPRQGDVLCHRFQVISRIGSGSQGSIYHVKDLSGRHYAAKVVNNGRRRTNRLESEVEVLTSLQRDGRTPEGFPDLHFAGKHHKLGVLCMNLLGANLYSICESEGFRRTAFRFASEMLDRLETLHNHGFIHGDVKPQNYVVDHEGKVHLIDFAMARRYQDPNTGRHFPKRRERTFSGTLIYASLNAQRMETYSRRDDLESLGYSVIEMITGSLPWDDENLDIPQEHQNSFVYMAQIKESITLSELCRGLPNSVYEYMAQVTTMSYSQTPDYRSLRKLLKRR